MVQSIDRPTSTVTFNSSLVQAMLRVMLEKLESNRNDVQHDINYLTKHAEVGSRAVWIMKSYSTQILLIDTPETFFTSPDFCRAARSLIRYYINLIDNEKFNTAYLIHISSSGVLDGTIEEITPDAAKALFQSEHDRIPEPPAPNRSNALVIEDLEYYEQVLGKAEELGLESEFKAAIDGMRQRTSYQWFRCRLYRDFAPLSFRWFAEYKTSEDGEWQSEMNGGLIYWEDEKRWRVHT